MEEQPVEGTIELVVPADTRLVRLARLVASGIGSAAGFDVEEIEDLRIAVDEGCSALIEAGVDSPLLLSFEVDGAGVVVLGSTEASTEATQDPERLSLSDQILPRRHRRARAGRQPWPGHVPLHQAEPRQLGTQWRLTSRRSSSGSSATGRPAIVSCGTT